MQNAHRPETAAVEPSRARWAVVVPLALALGALTGCTDPSPSTGDGSPAQRALEALPVGEAGAGDDYDRLEQFGTWADPDGNGCDARNDVLGRDLTGVVLDEDGCTVLSGTLEDPYTGETIDFRRGPLTSADVQIDHVVALKNAWISGADRLGADERTALANDPLNLLAVDGPTNGEKSAADAAAWLPPNEAFRCDYVAAQIAVKTRYDLFVTADEKTAMAEVLAGCPDQDLPENDPAVRTGTSAGPSAAPPAARPAVPPTGSPTARPAASPTAPAPAEEVYYPDCDAVRAAGAAPLRADQPGYRPALDRGGEPGVACEG
ncbi:GmrSD restriction endonuclease domain-containing protein [Kocuria sabuli]|uniref:GmrSD restriction endonuclease domain-containing protein n=2 Tax=Kocuria TaxID=57493 RepID=UPI0034D43B67